jgi:hypothetical protein
MNPVNIEILMNHSIGISDFYYRATKIELLDDYLKGGKFLTIKNEEKLRRQVNNIESHISNTKTVEFQFIFSNSDDEDKHEKELKAIRQEMEYKFQQLLAKINIGKLQF